MLRVRTIHARSAGASARYYTRYLAPDGPGEDQGRWVGRQASDLGLSGTVSTEDLQAILSGRDPTTGTQLGSPLVDRFTADGRIMPAVAGFDATFSAPKSLSAWWGLTGDPGLLEAHDLAVQAVLDHLERFGATTRVRVNGSRQFPDTHGLTMGAFRQATSREDDPQLHTHVVISTKVQAPDGRWYALDARYLKRKQRALGGLYQSVLRAELTHRYGVAWGPIANGQAEIAGMPAEVLNVFSKRTEQVNAALADKVEDFHAREGRDPTRWERAALTREAAADTRATKTGAALPELFGRWQDEAAELGWTPARLVTAMREAALRAAPATEAVTVEQVLEQLSTNGSTWTRAEILQAVCDLVPPESQVSGRRWVQVIESACDRVIGGCIALDPPDEHTRVRASDGRSMWVAPTEPYLTHERILAQEERILVFAMDAHDQPARPSPTVDRSGLDVLQAEAAAAVAGHDPLVLVVGPAGSGKTTALARSVTDLDHTSRLAFGVAPTAKAARVLASETGMPADTVAKLLYEWRRPHGPTEDYRLDPGTTVVVDEAGMLGTGALDELIDLAVSQHWRLVLVGDPRQLQAVGRGGMFDELCRVSRVHELAILHRFRHTWEQSASLGLRSGHTKALDAYLDHGRVTAGTFEDHLPAVAVQWIAEAAAGRSVAVTAETNDHVDQLNAAIQQHRRAFGHLGEPALRVAGNETAAVGDIVVTRRNDRTLTTSGGEPVRNRERWQVTAAGRDGSLTVSRLDGHGTVALPADYVRSHVRLGYAATAHGHQGDTVDVGLTIVTPATSHRSLYVGATRGRQENRLLVVTDEPDLAEARDVLEQVLSNERADVPAVVQRRRLAAQQPPAPATGTIERSKAATPVPRSSPPVKRAPAANPPAESSRTEAERRLAARRQTLDEVLQRAEPFLNALFAAEERLLAAEAHQRECQADLDRAAAWRRKGPVAALHGSSATLDEAKAQFQAAVVDAHPYAIEVEDARGHVDRAEREASVARIQERLDRFTERELTRPARDRGPDLGLGL